MELEQASQVLEDNYQHIEAVHIPDEPLFVPKHFRFPRNSLQYFNKLLVPDGLIQSRVDHHAFEIYRYYKGITAELQILVIMDGAFSFYSMLLNSIQKLIHCDNSLFKFRAHYVTLKTYVNDSPDKSRRVCPSVFKEEWITNKKVLIIEDVYDTGNLMGQLLEVVGGFKPEELNVAVLVHKRNPVNVSFRFSARWTGFVLPNEFIVGCGIDYSERFRELGHIVSLSPAGIEEFKK